MTENRHPEARAISAFTRVFDALWRASKGDGPGRLSFEGRLRRPPQDDGLRAVARLMALVVMLSLSPVFASALASAYAQPVADFYRGKRLTLISSSAVGGGYDQYARLLARHMARHIPGEPTITVQNMVGAEGIRAANHLSAVAAQDGTVFGGVSRNIGLVSLYEPGNTAIQFDARKFSGWARRSRRSGSRSCRRERACARSTICASAR